jgi:hypothetical protein
MVERARRWRGGQHDDTVLAILPEMSRLTLGIVGETMFGATDSSVADEVREPIDSGMALVGPLTFFCARFLERLPLPLARRFVSARHTDWTRIFTACCWRGLVIRMPYGRADSRMCRLLYP